MKGSPPKHRPNKSQSDMPHLAIGSAPGENAESAENIVLLLQFPQCFNAVVPNAVGCRTRNECKRAQIMSAKERKRKSAKSAKERKNGRRRALPRKNWELLVARLFPQKMPCDLLLLAALGFPCLLAFQGTPTIAPSTG